MYLTVDDRQVFAATGGKNFDDTKPVVVLIHGAGQDRTIWVLQTRYLAHHGFSVLAVDLPGHGESVGPALGSVEAMSHWIVRLLDAGDIARAHIVGHSMGALIALQCAADHPDRVNKICLVAVSESMPVHPELLAAAEANDPHAYDLMNGWMLSASGHRGGHENPGTWMLGTGIRTVQRAADGVLFTDFTACSERGSMLEAATKVEAETLFVLGSEDKMTPLPSGQNLANAVAHASVEVFHGAGHALMAEAPDRLTKSLERFLGNH